jgi:hypothetical protein
MFTLILLAFFMVGVLWKDPINAQQKLGPFEA